MAVQVSHLLLFILAFSTTVLDSSILGKSPFISNAFFFNIVQTAFDPLSPPLVLNMYVANCESQQSLVNLLTSSIFTLLFVCSFVRLHGDISIYLHRMMF